MNRFSHGLVAGGTLALLMAATPAAHAQNYFDTDGETIGIVSGETYIGQNNPDPFTVYTNAATYNDSPIGAYGQSTLEFNGGYVGSNLYAKGSSIVNLKAGYIAEEAYADTNATLNISGGSIGFSVFANNQGVVNITGGQIGGTLIVKQQGALSLFGYGLNATLVDGDLHIGYDGDQFDPSYSQYSLLGFLHDGTNITGQTLYFRNGDNHDFNLFNSPQAVPEPGSVAFGIFATGSVLGLIARKRKA